MFLTIRASLPLLTEAGAEHGKALVVNVSSMAAKGGTPGMSFYAAGKAGVNALTESAQVIREIQATELSPERVRALEVTHRRPRGRPGAADA